MSQDPGREGGGREGGARLCLNMIVRNEMANLPRCLAAVAGHVDCWVIGDTGSSDGTPDYIASFFAERGLPGELHHFPFENFEQARNAALDRAGGSALAWDYLLLADADMELVVEDPGFRQRLAAPAYRLLQRGPGGLAYWNVRLARRGIGARYRGVTHEYLWLPSPPLPLEGVWYRDHATGANRVDKYRRDIRLLTEALEGEPDNQRYRYYLAQSYMGAGRFAEAAEAFARRAAMGGWEEEAWQARLGEARARLQLGDEDGFLRLAMVAYNLRPHRPEPLYELARFYRERGMSEASLLYAEAGLALPPPRPEQDLLFQETDIYAVGLPEEYAIAAAAARDPARRRRGLAACDGLALGRTVPETARAVARANLFHYLEPATALLPSFAARPIGFVPPAGTRLSTAAVACVEGLILVAQQVESETPPEVVPDPLAPPGPEPGHTVLVQLSHDLELLQASPIEPPADLPPPAYGPRRPLEELQPFAWQGAAWCLAVARDLDPEGRTTQLLARLEPGQGGLAWRLAGCRVLRPAGPRRHERGWSPLPGADGLRLVRGWDPVLLLDAAGAEIASETPPLALEHLVDASQGVPFDGGWLLVAREAMVRQERRFDLHRFLRLDGAGRVVGVSRPFWWRRRGRERCAGLAWHPDGRRLLLSFSAQGDGAWIATVDPDEVRALLDESATGARPSASVPAAIAAPPSPAAPPAASPAAPPVQAARPAVPLPAAEPADAGESSWTPAAPAAGTELMLGRLRERLGLALDRIRLTMNGPGPANGDPRPRVAWMQHDADQRAVQWCADRAVVDTVDLFVFASAWQRDRYLAAFKLPAERCRVLHNATDVPAEPRPWPSGPPWRCAYASTPFRGLDVLLDAWERLRPAEAELHVWSSMRLYRADDTPYLGLYERARAMPGVHYHGIVPNEELRAALRQVHFLTYPSTFPETSCVVAIEAMAAGCRLVVSSLGALPETTAGFARVYAPPAEPAAHADAFAAVLRDELANPWGGEAQLALAQQRHCAERYDWRVRLAEWRRLIATARRRGPARTG